MEAFERTGAVLKRFREKGFSVIFVRHINTRPGASFFLPDTSGAEIHPDIAPRGDEPVVVKHAPNSFFQRHSPDIMNHADAIEQRRDECLFPHGKDCCVRAETSLKSAGYAAVAIYWLTAHAAVEFA